MDRPALLRTIAESGYNVGFGAKKHFATYDLVEKAPGWIGFISIAIGIFGLVFEVLSSKVPSATLAVFGIGALYITLYDKDKYRYDDVGKDLTAIFNDLKNLYRSVQGGADLNNAALELKSLDQRFYSCAISKQIALSDWYAHYKFFAQHQIDWIDEQKQFKFWRDKVPLSARLLLVLMAIGLAGLLAAWLAGPICKT